MNTDRDNLSKALREIASGSRRNKTARLRECFDEIEAAKAAGASNKTIVAALEANGLFFDVNTFKNARSRILKERSLQELRKFQHPQSEILQTEIPTFNFIERKENTQALSEIHGNTIAHQTNETRKISNPADLKKAKDQEINLDDYAE